jgi:GDP-L-fucose synthase
MGMRCLEGMNKKDKIYVAGHRGLIGSAIVRSLESKGYGNLILRTHSELDLTVQRDVELFFEKSKPDIVFLCAAKVGGIGANFTYPADFIYQNLMIASNVIKTSHKYGVRKLLNMGSSCIYPKMAPQPLKEEYLLTGPLEITNEAYAIAKISAIKLCKFFNEQYNSNYISVMPSNQFGPGDNYNLENSHVFAALIRKIHEAKKNGQPVTLWGDGTPLREFMYSEDLAEASVFLMENFNYNDVGEFINVGTGRDISIRNLAYLLAGIIDYKGKIEWDPSKPNGTPRKVLDVSRIKSLGWEAKTTIREGAIKTYKDFLKNKRYE